MKRLLNTLYVLSKDAYLSLRDENVEISFSDGTKKLIPLLSLEAIFDFSYKGASPALIGACSELSISFVFFTQNGHFLAAATGRVHGNVLLRREQYRIADDDARSVLIARNMIFGKVYNSRWCIERTLRDHRMRVDENALSEVSRQLKNRSNEILGINQIDELRGIEGDAANKYFGVFDQLILNQKEDFKFSGRNRRPPLDRVNAMLSFGYSLLANDCSSALEAVGLDSYVGFMHTDRPGRASLSLDLMEELRGVLVDRFVLSMINLKQITASDFNIMEGGAVLLNDSGRKKFIQNWQKHKTEEIMHPYLKEKMQWGLVPFVQATLLARYIRNDLNGYPPFLWK